MMIFVTPTVYETVNAKGEVLCYNVETKVRIEFSPSEGYDCEKLAKLEKDLAGFIDERLDDALKKEEP